MRAGYYRLFHLVQPLSGCNQGRGQVRKKLPHVEIVFGGVQATHTDRATIEAFPQST